MGNSAQNGYQGDNRAVTYIDLSESFSRYSDRAFPPHKGECKKYEQVLHIFTIPVVTLEEICWRIGNKTPGLDAVPNNYLKLAFKTKSD